MDPAIIVAIIAATVAVGGPLVTWRIAKRQHSGAINTSDAVQLWTESATMRSDLRTEIVGLRAQLVEASKNITNLLAQIATSNAATASAREETRQSRLETAQLRLDILSVHAEVKTGNALTMGALADNAESRRISRIPRDRRTDSENEHINTVGSDNNMQDGVDT